MKIAVFLAVTIFTAAFVVDGAMRRYDVVQDGPRKVRVVPRLDSVPDAVASGSFDDSLLQTGWNTLTIVTNATYSDEDQAYAAGYFEGSVTYTQAEDHYHNYFTSAPKPTPAINQYFDEHITWLESNIASKNRTSSYWYHVGLQWIQWQGLRDGLNSAATAGNTWSINRLMALTSLGDLFDLNGYFNVSSGLQATDRQRGSVNWRDMSKQEFQRWFAMNTHCSSLFKLTDDLSDIFFGHAAWFFFRTTMRIFKHITLNYQDPATVSKTISMSSYPGMLSSFDDFYLTDSGMATIETSLGVLNYSMYIGNIKPQSLLYWQRVMVSNRLAVDAPHWAELVAYENSGTYNNQWMILDLKKFTPGKPLPKDTMWVAEQMPGIVASQDVTDYLRYGYYPSYNVPMNAELFVQSGYAEAVKTQGPEMNDYQTNVRAEIFRRDQANVHDLESFQYIMQYNDFENDPISNGNPLYAIASRVDLDPNHPSAFGAIDAKVSSYKLWKEGQVVYARSGPTPQQPVFGFNITSPTMSECCPNRGLPREFRFPYQRMQP